ncbi:MAG: hypothetical protein ABIR30_13385 [Chitinophagaceae bacterium]
MKKIILLITISFIVTGLQAQSYETIKTSLALNQFKRAKEDFDKGMTNSKFAGKAEAYILKTTVYASLAMDSSVINTPQNYTLTADANEAFAKYREMEPTMPALADPIYERGPNNLYASWYNMGIKDFDAKKWGTAYEKFMKAYPLSTLLLEKKVIAPSLNDTILLYYTGVSAQNSSHKEDAAKFFKMLTDGKVKTDWAETAYRFMVLYSFEKNDLVAFDKYKALGKQLYPKSDYFDYDKTDFAIGLKEGFNEKLKALEEVLASEPDNYKANMTLGSLIYDTLNSSNDGWVAPANAIELEKKMVVAFSKAAAAKPEFELIYIYMGDHFINKAVKVNEAREAHATDMKTRTKPGTMASKEDIAKRDLLDKQYGDALEGARDPYEKAAALYAAKPKSDDKNQAMRDRQQYRKVASYLADVYAYKKIQAKGKPADQAKYAAEEKKWNELYDTIK